ncbi:hypothetical protein RhiJN_15706 [Ceratobasidium sp. AG-Ba]|nr:hypothetical protein RhiJN_15706 [Ceratobasidium sp. AG-Ba]
MTQRPFRYEALSGFFVQSDPFSQPNPHPPAFGLKARTSPVYWSDFQARIKRLQTSAPSGTRYVVCWIARHGEGWHNVAIQKFGLKKWDEWWGKQNGDGEITWGPDARLTPLGEAQAKEVNEMWKAELARPNDPIPIASPPYLQLPNTNRGCNLREQLAPYTSEHRSTKAQIQATYPAFDIEEGFTEEDQLWGENFSELDSNFNRRIRSTLDKIFGTILESSDTSG